MATDQNSGLPVRTDEDAHGKVQTKLVDASGVNTATIDTAGNLSSKVKNAAGADAVNVQDGGNSLTVDSPQLPATLGQKTMAASAAVVIASDQSDVPTRVKDASGNGITSQASGAQRALDIGINVAGLQIDPRQVRALTASDVITAQQGGTWSVNIATSALPTGAATSANQVTGNNSLASIDTKIPTTLGQKNMAGSLAVVIASDQSDIGVALRDGAGNQVTSQVSGARRALDVGINVAGVQIDPRAIRALTSSDVVTAQQGGAWNLNNITGTVSLPTGASTSALQTSGNASLTSIDGKLPATLGQKVMSASMAVVIASDQSDVPTRTKDGAGNLLTSQVSGSQRALDVGINVAGVQIDPRQVRSLTSVSDSVAATQSGTWNISNITGTISLPTGAATSALQTSGNASLTSIDGKLPASVGQKAMANSLPVVLSSDQTGINTFLDKVISGTIAALNASVELNINGVSDTVIDVSGTWSGTLSAQASIDGVSYFPIELRNIVSSAVGTTTTANGQFRVATAGYAKVRLAATSWTSGSATVVLRASAGVSSEVTAVISFTNDSITTFQGGTWNLNNITGTVSLPTGAATEASLSAISTKLPTTLGQKTMANSLAVTVASDQSDLNIRNRDGVGNALTSQSSGAQRALDVGVVVSGVQVDPRQVRSLTASDVVTVNQGGTWSVGRTWTLASGTDSIAAVQSGTWNISNITGTVSLPTGAATSALQTTGNASLASIDGKLPLTLGQKAMAASLAVVIASDQSDLSVRNKDGAGNLLTSQVSGSQRALDIGINVAGVQVDPRQVRALTASDVVTANQGGTWNISNITGTVSLPTGAATSALQTTGNASLASIDGKLNSLGQKAMAASVPVVLASDQSILSVRSRPNNDRARYSAAAIVVPAATPTDIFTLTGSATRTVRIRRIRFTGIQTTAAHRDILIIKRSTANTAGTSTSPAAVPSDSANVAATAIARAYTANPTLGATVGTVTALKPYVGTAAAASASQVEILFNNEELTLRGVGEVLAINGNGATSAGGSFSCTVEWVEE